MTGVLGRVKYARLAEVSDETLAAAQIVALRTVDARQRRAARARVEVLEIVKAARTGEADR